ncbi:hypothetical protein ACQJBY_057532 [Aegilops geniculata]
MEIFTPRSQMANLFSNIDIPNLRIKCANDMFFSPLNSCDKSFVTERWRQCQVRFSMCAVLAQLVDEFSFLVACNIEPPVQIIWIIGGFTVSFLVDFTVASLMHLAL